MSHAQTLRQIVGDAFREAARVDEHQCRAMLADHCRQLVVGLRPQFARGHGTEFVARNYIRVEDVDGVVLYTRR